MYIYGAVQRGGLHVLALTFCRREGVVPGDARTVCLNGGILVEESFSSAGFLLMLHALNIPIIVHFYLQLGHLRLAQVCLVFLVLSLRLSAFSDSLDRGKRTRAKTSVG